MSRTQLLDQLLLLSSMLQEDQDRELGAIGLTQRRTHVMWLVHHRGPLMQRDIANEMGVTPRHVTTLVDELIEGGFARRGPHPSDRRAVLVSLTERGTSLMETMTIDHERLAASLTDGWSRADVDELRSQVETIVARLATLIADAAAERKTGDAA
ncbi:MAG: MarR family transcriptional regulator [Microbacterium sp.]